MIAQPASPWLDARNLLAVRLDNAGDVVMLGPALRAVKESSPTARITLLASPAGTQAAQLLPWVDDVITWRATWQDLGHLPYDPSREHDLLALLRTRQFDAALVFTSFSQSPHPPAYACLMAGIPLRAGESLEFGGAVLSEAVRGTPNEAHQVERNLRLVEALGFTAADRALAVAIPDAARVSALDRLRAVGVDPTQPFALIHPGASAVARRYPPAAWGAAARSLETRGVRTVLTGVEKERPIVEEAAIVSPASAVLAGETSLPEYAALVERAAVVLCGNTLPLHLADAVGTPVVAAYSGTDLESQWRPRAVPHALLRRPTPCHPCYRFDCPVGLACLDIPPAEIADAALRLITDPAPPVGIGKGAGDSLVVVAEHGDGPNDRLAHGPGAEQEGPNAISFDNGADPRATPTSIAGTTSGNDTGLGTRHAARGTSTRHWALGTPPRRRIAVVQALALGDLICATPALRALRTSFPAADIAMIALPWAEDVLRRAGLIDRFLPFPGWPGIAEARYDPARLAAFLAQVAAEPFDLAFQFHGSGQASNGFVAALGAKRSIGYATGPDDRLTDALPWSDAEPEPRRWLRLAEHAGAAIAPNPRPEFPLDAAAHREAASLLEPLAASGGPLVGLHAGASDPARRWPAARFAELATILHRRHGTRLLLTGGAAERGLTATVAATAGVPILELAGQTDLPTFAALIARLDLLVTNDTGASHLAAAAGAPSVVLFGPTDPARWAPLDRQRHLVIDAAPPGADRAATGSAALATLPVAPVLAAAERQLAHHDSPRTTHPGVPFAHAAEEAPACVG